jgi:hypothetical protein
VAIKVKVPNGNFDGVRGGIKFEKGVGIFEDEAKGREIAASFGYEIVEDVKVEDKTEAPKKASRKKAKKDEE